MTRGVFGNALKFARTVPRVAGAGAGAASGRRPDAAQNAQCRVKIIKQMIEEPQVTEAAQSVSSELEIFG